MISSRPSGVPARGGEASLALVVLAGSVACAGSGVKSRTNAVAKVIAAARDNGAQRCAPVELAMAESHNDFARHDLSIGDYYAAKRQIAIAEENAQLAFERSPADVCNPKAPTPPPKPGDADGDGILDNVDECPKVPEDKDGYEDEDGCPEEDNDSDGILDKDDGCPLDPEDRDGFEDAGRLPRHRQRQGRPVRQDRRVPRSEPEDKDGFEDDDGCPDCDDDKDGVPECPEANRPVPGRHRRLARRLQEVPPDRRHREEDRAQADGLLRHQEDHDQAISRSQLLDEVAQALAGQPDDPRPDRGPHRQPGIRTSSTSSCRSGRAATRCGNYLLDKGVDGARMICGGLW